jgi:hypothetical protein
MLARKGEPKYPDQVRAGLIDDAAELEADQQRRAKAVQDDLKQKAQAKSVSSEIVRRVLAAAQAQARGES